MATMKHRMAIHSSLAGDTSHLLNPGKEKRDAPLPIELFGPTGRSKIFPVREKGILPREERHPIAG